MGHGVFLELIFLLATSVFLVWLFKRLKLPAILAYLIAGVIAGPQVFSIIAEPKDLVLVAELGIVFLLFSLGLEFSVPKLVAMRHLVFGVGSAQVVLTLIIFMLMFVGLDQTWESAFIIGSIFALSSTAVVVKSLNESGLTQTKRGQIAISILLFQDIAVVAFLIAIPILGGDGETSVLATIAIALAKGALVVTILLSVGKWVLPRIFNQVAQVRTDELFVLTAILVTVLAGTLTSFFGLSMALGAFLAGMMLSESQYKHQLEADIRPFRDILMGLFFISVGMELNIQAMLHQWVFILSGIVIMLLIKTILIRHVAVLAGETSADGWSAGLMLFQMGEFGFVLVALAQQFDLISSELAAALLGIGVLSMAVTPTIISNDKRLVLAGSRFFGNTEQEHIETAEAEFETDLKDHVIICGFGRVGQTVSRFLKSEAVPYVVLDVDPVRVAEAQAAGENVQYGHARDKAILKAVKIEAAKLVVITFGDLAKTQTVINNVKQCVTSARIMVRTKSDEHMAFILEEGADQVVPEAIEGSLMLVSQVLFESGVPMSRVLRRIRKERENRYGQMHGFYQGEGTEVSNDKRDLLEFIHAIAIPAGAYSIGKTLSELGIVERRVDIVGLRRDRQEISNPDLNTIVQAQDIIVVKGKPRRVERIERFLMTG
ncbi:monovalent cation:proton antiporter family protein [Psychrosphaera aestuarii]|uniref:monovalent cation:proton antiporter family protein n=1 Tax=Psychrosphaera aestuarii TaxID=1266052 RepID=UPI001B337C24|nr:monovalent cation:proton antiporter family protein [Psychrosphaera aestuarii]